MSRRRFAAAAATATTILSLFSATSSQAVGLGFSQYSNDSTAAELLQASMAFGVTGSTLLVEITNEATAGSDAFDLLIVYFNSSDDVLGLSAAGYGDDDWTLYDDGYYVMTPLYGVFDHSIWYTGPNDPDGWINPGETKVFLFSIDCAAGAVCDAMDFASAQSDGMLPVLGSIRFVQDGGDAAFGGTNEVIATPEPGTAAMLALGLGGLAAARRRLREPERPRRG